MWTALTPLSIRVRTSALSGPISTGSATSGRSGAKGQATVLSGTGVSRSVTKLLNQSLLVIDPSEFRSTSAMNCGPLPIYPSRNHSLLHRQ